MEKMFTSRSAALCYQTCARKRFLAYHYGGPGLSTEALDINMLLGSCVHRGLQHLLEHCRLEHPEGDFEDKCIDTAVDFAIELWRDSISEHSLHLYSTEENNRAWVIAEHECLIEGLIRVFAFRRLRNLLEEYEVLEVEHEEVYEEFSPLVTFLGKADGLFRRKIDNKLVILSIKTTSEFANVTMRNILHDMQGCSEWAVIQDRLNRAWIRFNDLYSLAESNTNVEGRHSFSVEELSFMQDYKWFLDLRKVQSTPPEVYAVQYEHLITGKRREYPTGSGFYKRYNFLIHPMAFIPQTGFQLGSMQFVTKSSDYKWKWGTGKQPKGWETIDIWTDIGIKAWIELLASGKIQPQEGDPFVVKFDEQGKIIAGCLHTSELIIRTPDEIEEWKVSTKFQEEIIVKHLNYLNDIAKMCKSTGDWSEYKITLQELFPKITQNCHDYYGKDCQFVPVCHFGLDLNDSSHIFTPRESHHEAEKLYQIEKGWIKK